MLFSRYKRHTVQTSTPAFKHRVRRGGPVSNSAQSEATAPGSKRHPSTPDHAIVTPDLSRPTADLFRPNVQSLSLLTKKPPGIQSAARRNANAGSAQVISADSTARLLAVGHEGHSIVRACCGSPTRHELPSVLVPRPPPSAGVFQRQPQHLAAAAPCQSPGRSSGLCSRRTLSPGSLADSERTQHAAEAQTPGSAHPRTTPPAHAAQASQSHVHFPQRGSPASCQPPEGASGLQASLGSSTAMAAPSALLQPLRRTECAAVAASNRGSPEAGGLQANAPQAEQHDQSSIEHRACIRSWPQPEGWQQHRQALIASTHQQQAITSSPLRIAARARGDLQMQHCCDTRGRSASCAAQGRVPLGVSVAKPPLAPRAVSASPCARRSNGPHADSQRAKMQCSAESLALLRRYGLADDDAAVPQCCACGLHAQGACTSDAAEARQAMRPVSQASQAASTADRSVVHQLIDPDTIYSALRAPARHMQEAAAGPRSPSPSLRDWDKSTPTAAQAGAAHRAQALFDTSARAGGGCADDALPRQAAIVGPAAATVPLTCARAACERAADGGGAASPPDAAACPAMGVATPLHATAHNTARSKAQEVAASPPQRSPSPVRSSGARTEEQGTVTRGVSPAAAARSGRRAWRPPSSHSRIPTRPLPLPPSPPPHIIVSPRRLPVPQGQLHIDTSESSAAAAAALQCKAENAAAQSQNPSLPNNGGMDSQPDAQQQRSKHTAQSSAAQ